MHNPYFDYYWQQGKREGYEYKESESDSSVCCTGGVHKYSWAIPNEEAINAIVAHSPNGVVEIGAGRGYWAYLLDQVGCLVVAYDVKCHDENHYNDNWFPVLFGEEVMAKHYPDRTLFLCWPPCAQLMALNALLSYTGNTVVYVGEGAGGCTGDDDFHSLLNAGWTLLSQVSIPQWSCIHDDLRIFGREQ